MDLYPIISQSSDGIKAEILPNEQNPLDNPGEFDIILTRTNRENQIERESRHENFSVFRHRLRNCSDKTETGEITLPAGYTKAALTCIDGRWIEDIPIEDGKIRLTLGK